MRPYVHVVPIRTEAPLDDQDPSRRALRGAPVGDRRACRGRLRRWQQQLQLEQHDEETAKRRRRRSEGGGEKLTVGSDIPYPPFEQGKKGSYTGFDVELMEAIGKEIGREPEFIDSSFETIFRDVAQGKFEAVMSAATITQEREKVVSFSTAVLPLRTGDPGQRRQRHHRPRRPQGQNRRRPAGHDRPRTRQGKSRSQANSGPTRKALTRQRAEGRDGRSGDHRRAGGANSRPKNSAASKSSKKSRPKKRTGSRSRKKTPNCSNRSTKASKKPSKTAATPRSTKSGSKKRRRWKASKKRSKKPNE